MNNEPPFPVRSILVLYHTIKNGMFILIKFLEGVRLLMMWRAMARGSVRRAAACLSFSKGNAAFGSCAGAAAVVALALASPIAVSAADGSDAEGTASATERAPSKRSLRVHDMCAGLQASFVERLSRIQTGGQAEGSGSARACDGAAESSPESRLGLAVSDGFVAKTWLRDGGVHGGGMRYQSSPDDSAFAQASVNVSAVHYENKPKYPIDSATALSVILHPKHPYAPSMHFHISYIEPRRPGSKPYWRMIADLNPAIPDSEETMRFSEALRAGTAHRVSRPLHDAALAFGDAYFYVPSLQRHRGTFHFFLGKLDEGTELSADECEDLAKCLTETVIEAYAEAVEQALISHPEADLTDGDYRRQLEYHTLYLFQVMTLDRGTTHGLLAHQDNDVGTLASLPPRVDRELLGQWGDGLPPENKQRFMVDRIVATLPETGEVTDNTRQQLAMQLREHYRCHPDAKRMQADLDIKGWMEGSRARMETQRL